MKYYISAKISENISETPEGYLVCESVPLTRTGEMLYGAGEVPIADSGGLITITKTADEIFSDKTIASFLGKPITMEHPSEFVGPKNWQALAVGIVQNVRRGTGSDADKLLGDLVITQSAAIDRVRAGLREVSCGYEAEYIQDAPGSGRQINIIGNHLALVPRGRCGPACAIFDHAATINSGKKNMSLKDKLMAALGIAVDAAVAEEKPETKDEKRCTCAEDKSVFDARIAAFDARLEKFEAENKKEPDLVADKKELVAPSSDVIARAEIIAPGIAKDGDVIVKSLQSLYATEDGKRIIDGVTGGKALALDISESTEIIFNAASELVKNQRQAKLAATKSAAASDQKTLDHIAVWEAAVAKTHQPPKL